MNVDSIIKKFGYDSRIAISLKNIYPYLVTYFHDEKLVFDVLNNTPIHLCEDLYEVLEKENMLDAYNEGHITRDDLKNAFGGHMTSEKFSYNSENNSFALSESRSIIGLNTSTIPSPKLDETLAHEICHAIKSYYNQYKIEGNTVTQYSGLKKTVYNLSLEDGIVKMSEGHAIGYGFEEALNEWATEKICSMMKGQDYTSTDYVITKYYASGLFGYGVEGLDNIIFEAQMTHDDSKLYEIFGEGYSEFLKILDNVNRIENQYVDCNEIEKQAVKKELDEYLIKQYPIVDQMIRNKLGNGMTM